MNLRLPKIDKSSDTLLNSLRIVLPEIMALITSVITLVVCTSFRKTSTSIDYEDVTFTSNNAPSTSYALVLLLFLMIIKLKINWVVLFFSDQSSSLYSPKPSFFSSIFVPSLKRLSDVCLSLFIALVSAVQVFFQCKISNF